MNHEDEVREARRSNLLYNTFFALVIVALLIAITLGSKEVTYLKINDAGNITTCVLNISNDTSECEYMGDYNEATVVQEKQLRRFLNEWHSRSLFYRLTHSPHELVIELKEGGVDL